MSIAHRFFVALNNESLEILPTACESTTVDNEKTFFLGELHRVLCVLGLGNRFFFVVCVCLIAPLLAGRGPFLKLDNKHVSKQQVKLTLNFLDGSAKLASVPRRR